MNDPQFPFEIIMQSEQKKPLFAERLFVEVSFETIS